ncbi:MAG: hypothetical protein KYX69_19495 [Sphingomonas sp.]|uniref:hypothetical protein n=1 Tax=Sphingomonas sp. TaxID=28214 RepID=UPI002627DB6E|nr:hypothetical protein [Sphingomonas sp.]MDK2769888.1 hypothetical protein [Sphingomonas sp.]
MLIDRDVSNGGGFREHLPANRTAAIGAQSCRGVKRMPSCYTGSARPNPRCSSSLTDNLADRENPWRYLNVRRSFGGFTGETPERTLSNRETGREKAR